MQYKALVKGDKSAVLLTITLKYPSRVGVILVMTFSMTRKRPSTSTVVFHVKILCLLYLFCNYRWFRITPNRSHKCSETIEKNL